MKMLRILNRSLELERKKMELIKAVFSSTDNKEALAVIESCENEINKENLGGLRNETSKMY